jgi:hypothetical protein
MVDWLLDPGFPDFASHASDLSSHAHQHRLCSRKEPKISMHYRHQRTFSVPVACRFEGLNHPVLRPSLVSPMLWAVGAKSIDCMLHVVPMFVNGAKCSQRVFAGRCDRVCNRVQRRRLGRPAGRCPCHGRLSMGIPLRPGPLNARSKAISLCLHLVMSRVKCTK